MHRNTGHFSTDISNQILVALNRFPQAELLPWATPLEPQVRLSKYLGINLLVKRDDLTGLAFGGNKVRKLEFYFGKALSAKADSVLITGAVQSNYVRAVAACAARFGMECHIQLEDRVPGMDSTYRSSGNVLISQVLGATLYDYPHGEDESGADKRLYDIAEKLKNEGKNPFVIPLGADHPPLGALGYIKCTSELLRQQASLDYLVTASGSGQTHAGLLFGLRACEFSAEVIGICVRRSALQQEQRISSHCEKLAQLLGIPNPVKRIDIELHDEMLAPGYGIMNEHVAEAISQSAMLDGLLTEPVYTGRAMAGLFKCVRDGRIPSGATVVFMHTGGLPALFGYERDVHGQVVPLSNPAVQPTQ